jgi:hypothetical protein
MSPPLPSQHTSSYLPLPIHAPLDHQQGCHGGVLNEMGLDPGIDHLYTVRTVWKVHEKEGGGDVGCVASIYVCHLNADYYFGPDQTTLLHILPPYSPFRRPTHVCRARSYIISPAHAFVAYPNGTVGRSGRCTAEGRRINGAGDVEVAGVPGVRTLADMGCLRGRRG